MIDIEVVDIMEKCRNCFHMVRYITNPDNGWCGNLFSLNSDKDVDMDGRCEYWNRREPFVW